jgi:hypothetical protein
MDAFKYLMQGNPTYIPGFGAYREKGEEDEACFAGNRKRDPITAY